MLVDLTKIQLHYLDFLVAEKLTKEPEYVNQAEAFRRFKRSNVERWVSECKVIRHYRPKSVEYRLDELRKAAAIKQDYQF